MWRLVAMMGLTSLMLVVIIQAQSDELDSLDPLSLKETMEIVETCLFCVKLNVADIFIPRPKRTCIALKNAWSHASKNKKDCNVRTD